LEEVPPRPAAPTVRLGTIHTRVGGARTTEVHASDRIYAGRGTDRAHAGPGTDHLSGGPGNDRLFAFADDGATDVLDCGGGAHDYARIRAGDNTLNCETVETVP
jgi:hypothetical protein